MLILASGLLCAAPAAARAADSVRVLDKRLQISVFAEAPQIVTPTGIAVDHRGHVLVIESHTHFPREDYSGPREDRIKRFVDRDGDGRAETPTVFYSGGRATMNLAVYHDGSVFVATRSEIFRLFDDDGDGKAERRQEIARLKTTGSYPHNGLSGFAFRPDGRVYFGLGENLGVDYRLIGSDGTQLSGGGEGGSIYRIDPDGKNLSRVATGFWNPFHLAEDRYGRLLAVDNDPDSRPPCRMLHVVQGGDYGYRFRNGRRGTHPFTSWFGTVPGTLGLAAETGEAPSGLLAYESDRLPAEYQGALLGTSWGDHLIQRFPLRQRGATVQAAGETVVQGGRNFRPVGIALAPDGSLLISDWVDRSYSVHGKGRIWRLTTKNTGSRKQAARSSSPHRPERRRKMRRLAAGARGVAELNQLAQRAKRPEVRADAVATLAAANKLTRPTREAAARDSQDGVRLVLARTAHDRAVLLRLARTDRSAEVRATALRRLQPSQIDRAMVDAAMASPDPFLRQAARALLARSSSTAALVGDGLPADPTLRRGIALLLRQRNDAEAQALLPELLNDEDASVRFVAIQWVGERRLRKWEPRLREGLTRPGLSGALFDATLAALHLLGRNPNAATFEKEQQEVVIRLLKDQSLGPQFVARALRRIPPTHPWWTLQQVRKLLRKGTAPAIRLEAVRSLREMTAPDAQALLRRVATAEGELETVRAAAVMGLAPTDKASRKTLLDLAANGALTLASEALRGLQSARLSTTETHKLASSPARTSDAPDFGPLRRRAVTAGWKPAGRPASKDLRRWKEWLGQGGDAARGERIFFHTQGARCYACHRVNGRGGLVGPDLSAIGKQSAERLLEGLIFPSAEIAPQFTPWRLQLNDGRVLTAVLVTERGDKQRYADAQGRLHTIEREAIEMRSPLNTSIMPQNLAERLTDGEIRDLLAFLRSRRD